MSVCDRYERLSAYYDGEMSDAQRAEMEAHVAACPACAAELSRLERLSGLLRTAGAAPVPPLTAARLRRGVQGLTAAPLARLAEAAMAVAAGILILCGAYLWGAADHSTTPSEPLPVWETVAVARDRAPATASREQVAQWIVLDLGQGERE
jgi:anti-sigma factor RsiW